MRCSIGMKFVLISDTHNKHEKLKLPACDFLIHAGDISQKGKPSEILNFLEWFKLQPARYKIFIAGNHDFCFEEKNLDHEIQNQIIVNKIHYLNDSGCVIEGVKFWGSPITPWFHDWAFNRHRGNDILNHWSKIPSDTQVLITHGPPANILDRTWMGKNVGCEDLSRLIFEEKKLPCLKLHVFGHIHEDHGISQKDDITFINASSRGMLNLNLKFFEFNL